MSQSREGPLAVCRCGHTGQGPGSQHESLPFPGGSVAVAGAGRCRECACPGFTWDRWTDERRRGIRITTGATAECSCLAGEPERCMIHNPGPSSLQARNDLVRATGTCPECGGRGEVRRMGALIGCSTCHGTGEVEGSVGP